MPGKGDCPPAGTPQRREGISTEDAHPDGCAKCESAKRRTSWEARRLGDWFGWVV